jgi:hypothetical protein
MRFRRFRRRSMVFRIRVVMAVSDLYWAFMLWLFPVWARNRLIAKALGTVKGRIALAKAMIEPIRDIVMFPHKGGR